MRNPECRLCPLGQSGPEKTCWMNPEPEQCDVMVVAETPLHYDIQYSEAFAGKGLREIKSFLEKQGIKAHYTYAAKCPKPGKDFKIKEPMVKICSGTYLTAEIEAVRPKHIIVLGANAMYGAWRKKGITEKMGNRHWDEKLQAHVYPTLHQAQALYDDEHKETLFRDLTRFCEWIKGQKQAKVAFEPPVHIASTLKSLRKLRSILKKHKGPVAVDTETNGLNTFTAHFAVRSIQFCWDTEFGGVFVPLDVGPGCYFVDGQGVKTKAVFWENESLLEAIEIIRDILKHIKCVWHNGKFDRLALYNWGKRLSGKPIRCPHIYMDTLHVAHLLNENRRLGLKKLITSELGYPSYDIGNKLTQDMTLLIPYAARDTVASLMLCEKYTENLSHPEFHKIRRFYTKVIRKMDAIYTKMELRGWPVDGDKARQIEAEITAQITAVEAKMQEMLVAEGIMDFTHYGSPIKLSDLIFKRLRYAPSNDKNIAVTESGNYSTNEDALVHLKHKPFVAALLEWRGLTKALSTYVRPMIHFADTRGRITTSYKLTGTVTGRTASGKEGGSGSKGEGMNLQNIPHAFGIKKCIKPHHPDWVILEADFSQIELRILGELSQDDALLWAYSNGIDLHTFRAQAILGMTPEDWANLDPKEQKSWRSKAKPCNFGFAYSMSHPRFKQYALTDYGVEFSMEEAREMRESYYRTHHGLPSWYKKQEAEAKRKGYVESLSGRRRHLPNIGLDPGSSRDARSRYNQAVRYAINTPVQGFASDLKLMSLVEVDETISPTHGYIIGEVHDSILMEVHKDHAVEIATKLLKIMAHPKLLDELGITLTVPIEAEAAIGPSYGETETVHV